MTIVFTSQTPWDESIAGNLRRNHFVLKCQFAPEYEKCRTKDKTWKLNFIPVYNMWLLKKKLCVCLKSLQGCTTLSDTMDCSPLGNSVRGILQARILECAAMSSSSGHLRDLGIKTVSCISYTAGWFFTTEPPLNPPQKRMKYVNMLTNSINLHGTISWFTV